MTRLVTFKASSPRHPPDNINKQDLMKYKKISQIADFDALLRITRDRSWQRFKDVSAEALKELIITFFCTKTGCLYWTNQAPNSERLRANWKTGKWLERKKKSYFRCKNTTALVQSWLFAGKTHNQQVRRNVQALCWPNQALKKKKQVKTWRRKPKEPHVPEKVHLDIFVFV